MTKPTPKAYIDFERDLWKAADELRSALAENQYKDYVLFLIFTNHFFVQYEIRKEEVTNHLKYPKSNCNTVNFEDRSYMMKDANEFIFYPYVA